MYRQQLVLAAILWAASRARDLPRAVGEPALDAFLVRIASDPDVAGRGRAMWSACWRYSRMDARRKEARRHERARAVGFETLDRNPSPDSSPQEACQHTELTTAVHTVLDGLAPAERELMILRYFMGLAFRDIGFRLGIEEASVRSLHSRTLRRLSTMPAIRRAILFNG
jgi:RNA polymerase sigma factor (sigma-70 family)